MESFTEAHDRMLPMFEGMSRSRKHSIPGMTRDEVLSEMRIALWKAYTSYDADKNDNFDAYWWRVWMNHKSHLIEAFFRIKRRMLVPVEPNDLDVLSGAYGFKLGPECPVQDGFLRRVWDLIAQGATRIDIQAMLNIDKRQYDAAIEDLRGDLFVSLALT